MERIYLLIAVIVALCIALVWLWFWLRKRTDSEGEMEVPKDAWSAPETGTDNSSLGTDPSVESETSTFESVPLDPPHELVDLTPKFKAGDRITNGTEIHEIIEVRKVCYILDNADLLPINKQGEWKLVDSSDHGFDDLIAYFSKAVEIRKDGKVYQYLSAVYTFVADDYIADEPLIYNKKNFPVIVDYFGDTENPFVISQMFGWLFAIILTELRPDLRDTIMQMGYDYQIKGASQPTYGWTFDDDPNIARTVAAIYYAVTRQADQIKELMKELGGEPLTYQNDPSEVAVDMTRFMPSAPGPYLPQYANRKRGYPVGAEGGDHTLKEDQMIHDAISEYYSLDSSNPTRRQATIQAISDKEYKKPHLFGKPHTVKDPIYGTMTFNPVFGKHNLGFEIPEDGAIAELFYTVGYWCSYARIPLLNEEYGRKRPGQGDSDGVANADPCQRVLVNYAIEDGDGRPTGYYNQGGDYVDSQGNHIGDYTTFYQNAVYANSYPSGHSAEIAGGTTVLCMVMPELAPILMQAMNQYALNRTVTRFHWTSDVKHGLVIGAIMVPILASTTTFKFADLLKKAQKEYKTLKKYRLSQDGTHDDGTSET